VSDLPSSLDIDAEASHVSVQAVPGAVFLRLRRERESQVLRRMFVELTLDEAQLLYRELAACIGLAGGSRPPLTH